jgi:hypothetical protein
MRKAWRVGWLGAASAVVLTIGGCAGGQEANDIAGHFTPGSTTRAEAIAQLGAPSSVFDQADGSKTVTWARDGGLFNPDETHGLSIVFGPDDKMVRVAPVEGANGSK